jgi:hypothetical protein
MEDQGDHAFEWRSVMRYALSYLLVAIGFAGFAYAQAGRGAILGNVTDATGTPIAKAKVTATNAETRAKVTASTASDGGYGIRNLPAGRYDVATEAKGFKKSVSEMVQIDASSDGIRVDIQLEETDKAKDKREGQLIVEALEHAYTDPAQGFEHHEENGIHACKNGYAIVSVNFSWDSFRCNQILADASSEESMVDANPGSQRQGIRACPIGWYMRGVREMHHRSGFLKYAYEFELLCSRSPDVELKGETVCPNSDDADLCKLGEANRKLANHYFPACGGDNAGVMNGITMGKDGLKPAALCSWSYPAAGEERY